MVRRDGVVGCAVSTVEIRSDFDTFDCQFDDMRGRTRRAGSSINVSVVKNFW